MYLNAKKIAINSENKFELGADFDTSNNQQH